MTEAEQAVPFDIYADGELIQEGPEVFHPSDKVAAALQQLATTEPAATAAVLDGILGLAEASRLYNELNLPTAPDMDGVQYLMYVRSQHLTNSSGSPATPTHSGPAYNQILPPQG